MCGFFWRFPDSLLDYSIRIHKHPYYSSRNDEYFREDRIFFPSVLIMLAEGSTVEVVAYPSISDIFFWIQNQTSVTSCIDFDLNTERFILNNSTLSAAEQLFSSAKLKFDAVFLEVEDLSRWLDAPSAFFSEIRHECSYLCSLLHWISNECSLLVNLRVECYWWYNIRFSFVFDPCFWRIELCCNEKMYWFVESGCKKHDCED